MTNFADEPEVRSTGTGAVPTPAPAPTPEPAATNGGEHGPTPLLAVLGAGEAAVAAVARAFADARARALARRETVAHRVGELPTEFEELRTRFSGEELRHALETYRAQINRAYAEFAARGEQTWDRLREQPQVRNAQGAAEKALSAVSRQTRVTGDKAARAGQRFTGKAADAVVDVTAEASSAVEEAGTATASAIQDAGDGTAAATRGVTRTAAEKAAPGESGTASGKASGASD
jgi:heparin binding hemagglutinin HbhA